ncbi:sodium:solute symporter family protein [bacterium]|nr:sodium:solute symporter family protein [bacterium]
MAAIDYCIFGIYMACMLGIGYYFFIRNRDIEDYYVGGRRMSAEHVGISIVATDVGGGFSIGLGGLGFTMGLAGSWLLFTGLVGAWLSAVFIIPRIKMLDDRHSFLTYPDFLRQRYDGNVALVAALISGIGYLGFTGAQVLAGAKLASSTIIKQAPFGMSPLFFSLFVIAMVILIYTVLGGLKAVIYTDSVQWAILMIGLIFLAFPYALKEIGGFQALVGSLPRRYFSLGNISGVIFLNWMVTIIPIWLVGMTLYQRVYACRDTRDARKAWFIAGIFEYPIMAFMGVLLGMCARVLYSQVDPEMGLPLLISEVLPVGVAGVVVAAYFSAIMSTADSCLMASSGNFVNDIIQHYFMPEATTKTLVRLSQIITLFIGVIAVIIAASFTMVLDAILYAYAFMVSGLTAPTLAAYFWKRTSARAAFWSMISGGTLTLSLMISRTSMPFGLDPSFYGIAVSSLVLVLLTLWFPDHNNDLEFSYQSESAGA